MDICVSNDLDEVFRPGWRQKLEQAWKPGHTRARYLFTWSQGPGGKQFPMEKIHRRQDFRWVHPVHEVLKYTGKDPDSTVWVEGMILDHFPDHSKPRAQYLPLLELSAAENPDDDRVAFWLGREYMYYGRYDESIDTLQKYLKMPSASWNRPPFASMRWIASSYHHKRDNAEALRWYLRAIAEVPQMREPYVECAQMGYRISDWPLSFYMAQEALKIKNKSTVYVNMWYAWDHTPDDTCAIVCYRLGLFEQALQHARAALDITPDNERLKNNLKLIEERLAQKTTFCHE